MTFVNISRAFLQGYSVDQVIKWLLKNDKILAPKIKNALNQGYSNDQIAEYLTKGKYASFGQKQEMLHGMTEKEKAEKLTYREPFNQKAALAMAAAVPLAVGGATLARPGMAALGSLLGGGPPSSPQVPPQVPTSGIQGGLQQQAIQRSTGMGIPQSTEEIVASQAMQPPMIETPQQLATVPQGIDSRQLVESLGLMPHVEKLANLQKDPRAVAAILYNQFPQEMKKLQQSAGKPMEEVIADIMPQKELPSQISETFSQNAPGIPEQNIPEEQEIIEEEPINIGSEVITKDGKLGKIEKISGNTVQIRTDDGIKGKKLDEIIDSPIPEKDLADLYNELLSGIHKETGQEISRNVMWAGYDPKNRELLYQPHGGASYIYDNISEEIANELTSLLTKRKTTGENYIGGWEKGTTSPIGAAMSALIKKLQSERGKGQEYSRRFETLYDAIEPARKAAKRKYEERTKKTKKPKTR